MELTSDDVNAWLDGYLTGALAQEGIAGAVVSVVRHGAVITERGYGLADTGIGGTAPVSVNADSTLFRIGSVSKLVTAAAVVQLVEADVLDLDAPVQDYLDFDLPTEFDTPVTLRHLLSHTAGFEDVIAGVIGDPDAPAPELRDVVAVDPPEQIYEPGTVPAYSNYSNALAGYVVEHVSGLPFADYVSEHIFQPAGMGTATLAQPLPEAAAVNMSRGYNSIGSPEVPFEMVGPAPAGAVSATGADMSAFMLALLGTPGADGPLMSSASTALMQSPALDSDTLGGLAAGPRMGLGFYEQNRDGHRGLGHAGDLTAFHAELRIYPDDATGIFIALNSSGIRGNSSTLIREQVMNGFADRYFGTPVNTPNPVSTAVDHGQGLAGTYLLSRRSESTFAALFFFLSHIDVAAAPDGTVTITAITGASGELTRFTEVEPWVWQEVGGQRRIAVDQVDGVPRSIGLDAAFTLVPMPASQAALLPVALFAVVVLMLSLLLRPIGRMARWHYRSDVTAAPGIPRLRLFVLLAHCALIAAGALWLVIANSLLSDTPPPAAWVFRSAQVLTLIAVAGVIPAAWLATKRTAHALTHGGVREWLAAIGLAILTVGFAGLGYVALIGGMLQPSISY